MRRPLYDLSEHPEHAQAIGEISAQFNLIEYQLSMLFGFLMRAVPWHSREAYYAVINANARIDMMRALIKQLNFSINTKKKITTLLDDAKAISGKRNDYVHALWFYPKGKNPNPRRVTKFGDDIDNSQSQPVTLEQLIETRDRTRAFAIRTAKFVKDLSEQHPIGALKQELNYTSRRKF
jgi:hypothetical protein